MNNIYENYFFKKATIFFSTSEMIPSFENGL